MASPELKQVSIVSNSYGPSLTRRKVQRDLVTANHILHMYGAVDGFGHVSVRHPENPKIYLMCGYIPPALVESVDDLIEYWVDGSDPGEFLFHLSLIFAIEEYLIYSPMMFSVSSLSSEDGF